ncbi:MAG: LCP family protein [Defluviitaleaceae bacterium]|nr:LCP family protein [Defluviitaleaceae bacterium]
MDKFLLKKYVAIVVSLVSCFAIIGVSASMAHSVIAAGQIVTVATGHLGNAPPSGHAGTWENPMSEEEVEVEVEVVQRRPALPDLNILLLGIDDGGGLPDVIMVIAYDGENNAIDIISIPRDTQVVMTDYERNMLREAGRWFPNHGVVKLNELHSFGGSEVGYRAVSHHVGNMLGIEIDNYIILDIDAFRYIVDAVGGVYMDIRPQGLFYTAPGGTIMIRVPGGRQLLDGNMAEQVVRFRQYHDGDLGRIDMTQQFMHEFFVQVLASEHIMNNAGALARSFMSHVRTDFGLLDILRYAGAADALNPDSIEFHTVPGHARMAHNPVGVNLSWYFVDEAGARELMNYIRIGNINQ